MAEITELTPLKSGRVFHNCSVMFSLLFFLIKKVTNLLANRQENQGNTNAFAALGLVSLLGLHRFAKWQSGNANVLRCRLVSGPLFCCKAVFIFIPFYFHLARKRHSTCPVANAVALPVAPKEIAGMLIAIKTLSNPNTNIPLQGLPVGRQGLGGQTHTKKDRSPERPELPAHWIVPSRTKKNLQRKGPGVFARSNTAAVGA